MSWRPGKPLGRHGNRPWNPYADKTSNITYFRAAGIVFSSTLIILYRELLPDLPDVSGSAFCGMVGFGRLERLLLSAAQHKRTPPAPLHALVDLLPESREIIHGG